MSEIRTRKYYSKSNEDLNKRTVTELQSFLRERNLPVYYRVKKDLVIRLQKAIELGSGRKIQENNQEKKLRKESSKEVEKRIKQRENNQENFEKKMNQNNFSFKDIEESLSDFSGESGKNVKVWLKEFNEIATICNWNKVQKYIYGRKLLKGAAKYATECGEGCNTWEKLEEILLNEFGTKMSALEIHKALENRRKVSTESYLEYIYAMKKIASNGNLDEESIVEYIVHGIQDEPNNKVILYEAKTISSLKKKLGAYEKMNELVSKFIKLNDIPSTTKQKGTDKRCYGCGEFSHRSDDCPHKKKGPRCFKCGTFGHIAPNCSVTNTSKQQEKEKLNVLAITAEENYVMEKHKTYLKEKKRLNEQVNEKDIDINNLKSERDRLLKEVSYKDEEMREIRNHLEKAKDDIKNLKIELEACQKEKSELAGLIGDIEKKREKNKNLQKMLDDFETKLNEVPKKLSTKEVDSTSIAVNNLQKAINRLKNQLENERSRNNELSNELKQCKDKLQTANEAMRISLVNICQKMIIDKDNNRKLVEHDENMYKDEMERMKYLNTDVRREEDLKLTKCLEEVFLEDFTKKRKEIKKEDKIALKKIQEETRKYSLRRRRKLWRSISKTASSENESSGTDDIQDGRMLVHRLAMYYLNLLSLVPCYVIVLYIVGFDCKSTL